MLATASVFIQAAKSRLGKICCQTGETVFVHCAQSLAAYRESSCVYDETASGQTFYNYFRDYYPSTGRYIESDLIGLEAGPNTYGYVGGDPIGYADPLGLWAIGIEFYDGFGGGIKFGRDPNTGQGFITVRFGFGIGGGIDYEPLGGRPGAPKNCIPGKGGASGGVSGGVYGNAGGRAGPVKGGLGIASGFTTDPGGTYFTFLKPKASSTNRGTGINASASAGLEFSIFDNQSNCSCK